MTGTTGFRNGRVRVLTADDEPALTSTVRGARPPTAAPTRWRIRTARGLGCSIRPVEDGR